MKNSKIKTDTVSTYTHGAYMLAECNNVILFLKHFAIEWEVPLAHYL